MIVTKNLESEFIKKFTGKKAVSIPEIQHTLDIGYTDAKTILRLAIVRGWVKPVPIGIDYTIKVPEFKYKKLSEKKCTRYASSFDNETLTVLLYICEKFSADYTSIDNETDIFMTDVSDCLDELLEENLIIQFGEIYYSNIENSSANKIATLSKK